MPESSSRQKHRNSDTELVLPFNDNYELGLLGELLFTRDKNRFTKILSACEPYLFYRKVHQRLLEWAKALHREGIVPPLVVHASDNYPWGVLASAVKSRDSDLWENGGRKALAAMWSYFNPNGPAEWLLDQLIALSVARERVSIMSREIHARGGQLSSEEEAELWRKTDDEIRRLTIERQARSALHIGITEAWDALKKDRQRADKGRQVRLGIPSIDRATGGLIPGELVCLAGRANVGKTSLAANIVYHQLEDEARDGRGDWVCVFSMDMAARAFAEIVLMRAAGLPRDRIADEASPLIHRVSEKVAEYRNVRFFENPALTVEEIISHTLSAQAMMDNRPPAIVLIDHHGKILGSSERKYQSLYERTSETARAVKRAAQELKTVIVLLVQLSRRGGEGDIRPSLDMLRDSGVTEEEADLILGAWRPNLNRDDDSILSLVVLKSRRMARMEIECVWGRDVGLVEEIYNEGIPF